MIEMSMIVVKIVANDRNFNDCGSDLLIVEISMIVAIILS